jgi:hypothetical protein
VAVTGSADTRRYMLHVVQYGQYGRTRAWLTVLGVALLGVTPELAAQDADEHKRIAVVGMAPSLVIAVSSTLEPWHIEVAAPQEPLPAGSMAAMVQGARGIAAGSEAAAVVWIAHEEGEATLLVYDRAEDKIIALPLAATPPFDDPTNAAVALSIKTLLRHSGLIPPEPGAVTAPARPAPPPRLLVELLGTARIRPGMTHAIEPRFGLAARWFPAATQRFFALIAGADTGMGTEVDASGFAGRYTDTTAGVAGEARLELGQRWAAGLALGSRVHITELAGQIDGAPDVSEQRFNPSVDLGLRVELRVWRLELGVWGEASYMARRQEYLAGAETVLALPELEAGAGMLLGLPLW